jgi:hypothetical protein
MALDTTSRNTFDDQVASARSTAGRLLAANSRGKRRQRPAESLQVAMPVDARTRAGRAVRLLKVRLLSYLGPRATQAQLILVEQLLQLKLRLAMMDANFVAAGGKLSPHDGRQYLAWSNSLVRGLKALGLDGVAAETPMTLADALAAGAQAARGSAAADPALSPVPAPAQPPYGPRGAASAA